MSRSRKKTPIVKDKGYNRGERNRCIRRINKIRVKMGLEPKMTNEVLNQYDVCDFWFFDKSAKKYRK